MATCGCRCHYCVGDSGNPDVRDPIEAAVACDLCRAKHCPALLDGPRLVTPKADGYVDTYEDRGEGAE